MPGKGNFFYGFRPVWCIILIGLFLFAPMDSLARSSRMTMRDDTAFVLAIGSARVRGDNLARAKKRAISHALSKGIEDYIVRQLGDRDLINNFERITAAVLPDATRSVENFNLLTEQMVKDRCTVLVRIKVNQEILADRLRDAGILLTHGAPVKILLMVSETTQNKTAYWWRDVASYPPLNPTELALLQAFQDRGFQPINRTLNPPQIDYESGMTAAEPSTDNILKWGDRFAADMVVSGQCQIMQTETVHLSLNVLEIDTGHVICDASGVERVDNQDNPPQAMLQALQRLAKRLTARLAPCLMGTVAEALGAANHLHVILQGLHSFKQFAQLRTFLQQDIDGVAHVIPSRIKPSEVSAIVEFQGDRETFISRIMDHENRPFTIRLGQPNDGRILFDFK